MGVTIPPLHDGRVVLLVNKDDVPTDVVLKRKRGRPRKIDPRPVWDERLHHAIAAQVALDGIEHDDVFMATTACPSTDSTIPTVIRAAAIETAMLRIAREDSTAAGKDIGQVCSRRVEALHRLAGLVVRMSVSGQSTREVTAARIEQVKQLWKDKVRDVAHDVLPDQVANELIKRYAAGLEGLDLTG